MSDRRRSNVSYFSPDPSSHSLRARPINLWYLIGIATGIFLACRSRIRLTDSRQNRFYISRLIGRPETSSCAFGMKNRPATCCSPPESVHKSHPVAREVFRYWNWHRAEFSRVHCYRIAGIGLIETDFRGSQKLIRVLCCFPVFRGYSDRTKKDLHRDSESYRITLSDHTAGHSIRILSKIGSTLYTIKVHLKSIHL